LSTRSNPALAAYRTNRRAPFGPIGGTAKFGPGFAPAWAGRGPFLCERTVPSSMTEPARAADHDRSGPVWADVGGCRIWIHAQGHGSPTVVFESGGGDDASVWSKLEPEVRRRKSVGTVVYDRAGLGHSDPKPGPYRIDDEVAALKGALASCGVDGPLVLVAHSYGGLVSLLTAASDPRVAGLVLVDGNIPGFFDPEEVARLIARFTPHIDEIQKKAPHIARVLVPLMHALPETARRVRAAPPSPLLPIVDIVAEKTWVQTPEEVAALRREHAAFVAASPAREAVFATGSGHFVMRDQPELVLDAISQLIDRLRPVR
jgi:pimeloyl-ACP methyl ester carboxylesterase